MEDGNESLQTMGINTTFHDTNGYMDIEVKEDTTPTTDGTEVSTFPTETLPLADEKLLDILSKNQDSIPPELSEYLQKIRNSLPRRARETMSSLVKKGGSLDKWIVRKYGKIKSVYHRQLKKINNIKHTFIKQQFDQRIELRRQQQQRTQ